MITLVVAIAQNGVIGHEQGIPWHLPADLKRFRQITWGHPLVMGRRTYESIGKPLPGRSTIIVSRQLDLPPAGCQLAPSFDQAVAVAQTCPGGNEIMVVGGGEIYRLALESGLCRRIHLTRVLGQFQGSVTFPSSFVRVGSWRVLEETHVPAGPANPHAHDYFWIEQTDDLAVGRDLTREERFYGFRGH